MVALPLAAALFQGVAAVMACCSASFLPSSAAGRAVLRVAGALGEPSVVVGAWGGFRQDGNFPAFASIFKFPMDVQVICQWVVACASACQVKIQACEGMQRGVVNMAGAWSKGVTAIG